MLGPSYWKYSDPHRTDFSPRRGVYQRSKQRASGALTQVRDRHARASPARVRYFLDPIPTRRLPIDCSRPKGEYPSLMYISLSNHPLGFIAKFTTDSTMMLLTKANS